MEFRYKNQPTRKYSVIYGIIAIAIILIYIWDVLVSGFVLHNFISQVALPLSFLSLIVIWMSRYHARISDDIIRLQDDGVYQIRGGVITQIYWDEIIKVEWDKTQLKIISQKKIIEIGDHISNIDVIINSVKLRVGERFNTWDIPWELKHPKKKP